MMAAAAAIEVTVTHVVNKVPLRFDVLLNYHLDCVQLVFQWRDNRLVIEHNQILVFV